MVAVEARPLTAEEQMATAIVFYEVQSSGPLAKRDALRRCSAPPRIAALFVDVWERLVRSHQLTPLGDGRYATALQLRDLGLLDQVLGRRTVARTPAPVETPAPAPPPPPRRPVQRSLFE